MSRSFIFLYLLNHSTSICSQALSSRVSSDVSSLHTGHDLAVLCHMGVIMWPGPADIFLQRSVPLDNPTSQNMNKLLEYFRSIPPQTSDRDARLQKCGHIIYDGEKDITRRVSLETYTIYIYAYPSRGGIIILADASPADFDFLGLDRMSPPTTRHGDVDKEDDFCQKLLLLGAKWWDSVARYWLLNSEEVSMVALDDSDEPEPSRRERQWVSVAWPSTGGLVLSEFDTNMWGLEDGTELVPFDVGRLRLCVNMDEKAQMLQERFQGKLWRSAEEYQGHAFLGSWEWKHSGEVGDFHQTWE